MKFSTKSSLSLCLSLGVILSSISLFVYNSNHGMRMKEVEEDLKAIALHGAEETDRFLYERFNDITDIARDPVMTSRGSTPRRITERLITFRDNLKMFLSISFYDTNRIKIADTSGVEIGKEAWGEMRPLLSDVSACNEYVANAGISHSLDQTVIRLASCVKDEDGHILGTVVALCSPQMILEIVSPDIPAYEANGYKMHVFDVNEDLIMSTDSDSMVSWLNLSDLFPGPGRIFLGEEGSGVLYNRRAKEYEIVGFHRSPGFVDFAGLGWMTAATVSQKRALSPITRLKNQMILFTLVIILLTLPTSLGITHIFLKPLVDLRAKLARVGEGDLSVKADISSGDEIGEVAQAFNMMTDELKNKTTSLDVLRNEVTERVRAEQLLEDATRKLKEQNVLLDAQLKERKGMHDVMVSMLDDNNRTREELEKSLAGLRETQNMLIQAEKFEAIGILASGVAHETKNPLGTLLQAVNYFESHISREKKDDREVLQIMKDSINRANKIIVALSDLSKTGKVDLRPESIKALIDNSLLLVGYAIRVANVEVVQDYRVPAARKILADRGKIEQVFVNILTNAVQAMPEGGKITIRTYLTGADAPARNTGAKPEDGGYPGGREAVAVEVEDTGNGMSEESMNKLFTPFFTTKEPGKGTGLGLWVSRNIIEMHKGAINITSRPGMGTKVTMVFRTSGTY